MNLYINILAVPAKKTVSYISTYIIGRAAESMNSFSYLFSFRGYILGVTSSV